MVFLNSERDQFDIIFDFFTKFSDMSGCNINWDKSKAFSLGVVRNYQPLSLTEHGFLWSDNTIGGHESLIR